jgi:hypothetical protein
MGECIASPPAIVAPPNDNDILIHAYIPDLSKPKEVKYRITSNVTSDVNEDGCINLDGYFADPVDITLILDQPANTNYSLKLNSGLFPISYFSIISSDDGPNTKRVGKKSNQTYCTDCLYSSSTEARFSHRNYKIIKNIIFGDIEIPYTWYGFRYSICTTHSPIQCSYYNTDPGVKNGGQAQFHGRMMRYSAIVTSFAAIFLGLVLIVASFFRTKQKN